MMRSLPGSADFMFVNVATYTTDLPDIRISCALMQCTCANIVQSDVAKNNQTFELKCDR